MVEVLIIEDEFFVALSVEQAVRDLGYSVLGAVRSEANAKALADRRPPDLIIADINLGKGGNGIRAVQAIVGEGAPIPVIFVTANPELVTAESLAYPVWTLGKPFDTAQLKSVMAAALGEP
jgi:CheY-like chemotaxis protein